MNATKVLDIIDVAEVDRRGSRGIAVQVDHGRDDDVAKLFEKVRDEQGRLDLLVNIRL